MDRGRNDFRLCRLRLRFALSRGERDAASGNVKKNGMTVLPVIPVPQPWGVSQQEGYFLVLSALALSMT